ncbi:MAG: DUF5110 domain-containing protein [Pseudobutyrivibrio ruminis]|uniref:glycoside hydrolase family 31 protein n=1 Tax=Pseudobutyrivibrio ruminis TaxID=46206 RepID=UPI0026EAFFCF|nr:glycoside hydrolase family 31 protein [Pseudobutyrivibrio ruminis]MBE5914239.1 DUF5110 domain-containing protein [Pseudobutyrivibrio ruminis]
MNKYRISVLTDRLVRLEYQADGQFVDEPTQIVSNRMFPAVSYKQWKTEKGICIETDGLIINYDEQEFSGFGLSITLKANNNTWTYNETGRNFLGTARTLDEADGPVRLENGLFSEEGFAVIEDSKSALIVDGQIRPRVNVGIDIYFFGYGRDFKGGLKAFYALTGKAPMIPRYALGNWWSRFYKYTEASYLTLVDDFKKEKVPFSVAVIDMDWHITEVDPKYGNGWTGYTWDRKLFPDPARFLSRLHENGLAVTLNVHPADGIRGYEEMYQDMAKELGVDYENEEPIAFDFTDARFREIYFKYINHFYEDMGVDFWWIDWQQGTESNMEGVDPLWLLNHYYYLDSKRDNKRGMIFSRYSGPGSHRYPVGFSGDTFATWRSLDYQPFFTANAANIGYGCWSHDICGHMHGDKSDELQIRWLQFGVFSPIMRLHSSANPFFVKEPWNQPGEYREIMDRFMRLRHRLIPYMYTMEYLAYKEDLPMIRQMYFDYPEDERAYGLNSEYAFGDQLIVGAITKEVDKVSRMGAVNMFVPSGRYYDLFTGISYNGDFKGNMFRTVNTIPVLMKAGGIIPLESEETISNATNNPTSLDIVIAAGADGCFELYEDDGISDNYVDGQNCLFTKIWVKHDLEKHIMDVGIDAPTGNQDLIIQNRKISFVIYGLNEDCQVQKYESSYDKKKHTLKIDVEDDLNNGGSIRIVNAMLANNDTLDDIFEILHRAYITYDLKEKIYNIALSEFAKNDNKFWDILEELDAPSVLKEALRELKWCC